MKRLTCCVAPAPSVMSEPPEIHWHSVTTEDIDLDEHGQPVLCLVGVEKPSTAFKSLLLIVTPNEPTSAPNLP